MIINSSNHKRPNSKTNIMLASTVNLLGSPYVTRWRFWVLCIYLDNWFDSVRNLKLRVVQDDDREEAADTTHFMKLTWVHAILCKSTLWPKQFWHQGVKQRLLEIGFFSTGLDLANFACIESVVSDSWSIFAGDVSVHSIFTESALGILMVWLKEACSY